MIAVVLFRVHVGISPFTYVVPSTDRRIGAWADGRALYRRLSKSKSVVSRTVHVSITFHLSLQYTYAILHFPVPLSEARANTAAAFGRKPM